MPSLLLNAKLLKDLCCPPGQSKVDFHDQGCKGLMLELRASGLSTWYLRYRDARGRQRQFRIADSRDLGLDMARQRADELRGQIALGQDPGAIKAALRSVPTLESFVADKYMPFVKGYKRSWRTDECLLRNHILPALGSKHLDQISKADVIAIHHGRRAGGGAAGSANRLLILLRYVFNLALRWETPGLHKNPTADIPLFEENNLVERYLDQDEARRLYEAVSASDNAMLRFIIPMLIYTGARKRELLDARWTDFDLEKKVWRIPISKSGKARYIPLSEGALHLLGQVKGLQSLGFSGLASCEWVFPNPETNRPYGNIFTAWHTARTAAGLGDLRLHDLRHSFASFLINNGRSLYEVQKILGHTQIRTTQRYAHLSQETLLSAANSAVRALGNAFNMPRPMEGGHVEAMGGQLDVVARFPDGTVKISNFTDLGKSPA